MIALWTKYAVPLIEHPKFVNAVIGVLFFITAAVTLADFGYSKHGHYGFEEYIGFHTFYGFVSCVGLVLAATQMRKVVMVDEDFYDD